MIVTFPAILWEETLENVTETPGVVIPTIWTIQMDPIKSVIMGLAV